MKISVLARDSFSHRVGGAVYISLWLVLLGLGGCRSDSKGDSTPLPGSEAVVSASSSGEAPPLPGLDMRLVAVHEGAVAKRAQLTLEQILAQLPRPAYLVHEDETRHSPHSEPTTDKADKDAPFAADAGVDDAASAEDQPIPIEEATPPLSVQRRYLAGRVAWREGRQFKATQHLQAALRVCPRCPAVLRLLGYIYIRSGNQARGAVLLEKTIGLEPNDAESLTVLGRYKASQGLWEEAIVTLATAAQQTESLRSDPALQPLIHYLLGNALTRLGYDEAAIKQITAFLATPLRFDRTTRMVRELALLAQKRGSIWQLVGDAQHRMGRPGRALRAYQNAARQREYSLSELTRRLVYTHLKLGDRAAADKAVLVYLQEAGPGDHLAVDLLEGLAKQGRFSDGFVERLKQIYTQEDRPDQLALAIAGALDRQAAAAFLSDHLGHKPGDRHVFEHLIRVQLAQPGDPAEVVARALHATAAVVSRLPTAARGYSEVLVKAVKPVQRLHRAIDAAPPSQQAHWAYRFILAKVLAKLGDQQRAVDELEAVLLKKPDLLEARLQLAGWLIDSGQHEQAGALLDGVEDLDHPQVARLRVRLLSLTGRGAQALGLLDSLIGRKPHDVQLVIDKAKLQIMQADHQAAEKTLLDALDRLPAAEALYEQLIELYESGRVRNATEGYKKLLRRLWEAIPHSRVARLERVRVLSARRRFDQAEPVLRQLLVDDPHDERALELLLSILAEQQRIDEADGLLNEALEARGDDPALLAVALRHYRQIKDQPKTLKTAQMLLTQLTGKVPLEVGSIDALLVVMNEADGAEQADHWIEKRLAENPEDQQLLTLAQRHYARTGDKQKLVETAKRYLRLQPASFIRDLQIAELCLQNDQHQEAVAILLNRLADAGERPRAFARMLGMAMNGSGKPQEGDRHIRELIDQHPQLADDMRFDWALLCERRGDKARSQKILIELLKDNPDHAMANNTLGYTWALEGKDLPRAREMIERALRTEPDSAAYLDSMGWVLYKQGEFKEAAKWLQRARAAVDGEYPVILDHLGDAQYKSGRPEEAVDAWKDALDAFGDEQIDPGFDHELVGLQDRLREKIESVKANRQPVLAPVHPPVLQPAPPAPLAPEVVETP